MNNLPLESIADNTIIIDNIPAVESIDMLTDYGIANEYYIPPGQSLGSSCGAYILENYLKYNIIKQINDVETKK